MSICKCGCGQKIIEQPHHRLYGIPNFIRGHNSKGVNNPFYNKTHTEEFKEEQRQRYLGCKRKPRSKETKRKIGDANRGRIYTKEAKQKISEAGKGRIVSDETRRKMADSHRGNKTNFWKGGIDKKEYKHYRNLDYRLWREGVFKRDNYICQTCFVRGGFLHPHHIKSYTHYPELRYVVFNGKTLCKDCHYKLHYENYKVNRGILFQESDI